MALYLIKQLMQHHTVSEILDALARECGDKAAIALGKDREAVHHWNKTARGLTKLANKIKK